MKNKLTIAVIGGTGKSGKYLVNELINQGFQLKILLRNPDNFQIKNPLIEVIEGDVTNYDSVLTLLKGCQAVISTLGLGVPQSEPTIFSESTTNIIQAMNACNIQRYIVTTGINVDTPFDNKSQKTTFATEWMKKNYPKSTANKQIEFDILSNSNVNWTLVRLPLIELTEEVSQVSVSLEDCLGDKIGATDLANFLIEQLYTDVYFKKSPFVASI
ncbi:MAG: NAD(P)H-binding protein [Pseudarcicella sp.]|nr:NAD(P)H-binding protein [Pseudarcicella sp.]MBP6410110.1 NAD(P)H-binding protein [Pseudarcicella sp.]